MLTKREMKKRSNEEKERIILDIQRLGVTAGCRKHGIFATTYYDWLEKYEAGGVEGLIDRRSLSNENLLRKYEKEIKLLKEMIADKDLELKMKDELLKKKMALWQNAKK
jgi:putative transposase